MSAFFCVFIMGSAQKRKLSFKKVRQRTFVKQNECFACGKFK